MWSIKRLLRRYQPIFNTLFSSVICVINVFFCLQIILLIIIAVKMLHSYPQMTTTTTTYRMVNRVRWTDLTEIAAGPITLKTY